MIAVDENALMCDLAETYGIYHYRQLPPTLVAVFCSGLRENSRIKNEVKRSRGSARSDVMGGNL